MNLSLAKCYLRNFLIFVAVGTLTIPGRGQSKAQVELKEIAAGFSQITDVQPNPVNPKVLVVCEKEGLVKNFDLEKKQCTVLLKLPVRDQSEMGVLGLAFHPQFSKNRRLFVHYNPAEGEARSRIASFEWKEGSSPQELLKTERIILEIPQPYSNHNGGQIVFGPDGLLYIGLGDGGSAGDPRNAGQNLGTLLGKILRIDVSGDTEKSYEIPSDNPFRKQAGARDEIFAFGLRNPWKFSFTPDGRIIVGDVGQNLLEEVSIVKKGDNLGWKIREGNLCFEPKRNCTTKGLVEPIHVYKRSEGISITGGYVYTGKKVPQLKNSYVFGDFGSGKIWALNWAERKSVARELLDTSMSISTFAQTSDGEILVADFYEGKIYQLKAVPNL